MTPLYPAAAGGPETEAMDAFASAGLDRRAVAEQQGSVSLKASPKKGAAVARANPLIARYETILKRQELVWVSRRPFLRCLGTGGQGIVFLSQRQGADDFQRRVALKVFSPAPYADVASYETEMARLASVAGRVARIQQDNLVDVHNFIKHRGIRLLEMEWVDGYDLQRLCRPWVFDQIQTNVTAERWEHINNFTVTRGKESLRFKPGIAVSVLRGCLAAVAALHRDGIVHSDLKPSNIMLKRTGSTKIIDVGSAFDLYDSPPSGRCTPAYAAPEVLEGQPGSQQSDLASLGYVLLEMLCGEQPFAGKTRFAELLRAKKQILERLPKLLPPEEIAYSELLINLIRRLVDPDPSRRFSSAEAADLDEEGAAEFLRQLVKGDLASEYHSDVRQWIEDIEQSGGVGDERNSLPLPGECTLSLATLHPLDGELTD
ncbi:MAG TPA: serine/threonine-protein kinase [Planctomycetaceae bacterium]|jgi:serine/threonine-protein kinase|nr:serine/threonine-protein kinase [Planctomycetaceae bacterium]